MFMWIIKQPGIQQLLNWCGYYHDIYDWISPLNKPSGLKLILTEESMGKISIQSHVYFHLFEAFNDAFKLHC